MRSRQYKQARDPRRRYLDSSVRDQDSYEAPGQQREGPGQRHQGVPVTGGPIPVTRKEVPGQHLARGQREE